MEQHFLQHVAEFRRRLIKIIIALLLGFIFSLFLSKDILGIITIPAGKLVFLRPTEALMAQLKVSLLNGILVSLPIILWQIGSFIWPALYRHERKYILIFLPFIFIMFLTGLAFGYMVVVRIGYSFLLSFASPNIQPMISLDTYLSFVLSSIFLCGVIFLLPIMLLLLTKIGIIKTDFLWRQQKVFIIGLAVLVALITPSVDAFSMVLVFVPLFVLFEFSLFLARLSEKRRKKRIISE